MNIIHSMNVLPRLVGAALVQRLDVMAYTGRARRTLVEYSLSVPQK
jgi:hypothetical protein